MISLIVPFEGLYRSIFLLFRFIFLLNGFKILFVAVEFLRKFSIFAFFGEQGGRGTELFREMLA